MPGSPTFVYVDGFNLFYGCLKGTSYKWLNLLRLCELLLTNNDVRKIYYFTALVGGTAADPNKPQRQHAYVRALRTLPCVEVIDGKFIKDIVTFEKADGTGPVEVIRTKEKGTDVNMASQLLWDAHCNAFETAVLITGDSDFKAPIMMVSTRFKRKIGVLDPQRNAASNSPLAKVAHFYKPIRQGVLAQSQFPIQLKDEKGNFAKPAEWFD